MNKYLKTIGLGLCSLILFSACGGDDKSEPAPPTPPNLDEIVGIKLTLRPGEDDFKLAGLNGANIVIEGIKETTPSPWTYNDNTPTQKTFHAQANGGTVIIKGDVSTLAIYDGDFAKIDLNKVPTTFKNFICHQTDVDALRIAGATSLERLYLGVTTKVGPSLTYDDEYNFDNIKELDLTKLTNLKYIHMHGVGRTSANAIKFPSNMSAVESLLFSESNVNSLPALTTANLPNLTAYYIYGVGGFPHAYNFSGHTKLKTFYNRRSGIPAGLNLSNNSVLKTVYIHDSTLGGEINVLNTPSLNLSALVTQLIGLPWATTIRSNALDAAQTSNLQADGWTVLTN